MENYRKIMEKYLGRKLRSDEHVHHIDGNQHNNNISNLKIVSASEHAKIKHKQGKEIRDRIKKNNSDEDLMLYYEAMKHKSFLKALEVLFSPRQGELVLKRFKGEQFSKTEREYYSRCVKKKLIALLNDDLRKIAELLIYK